MSILLATPESTVTPEPITVEPVEAIPPGFVPDSMSVSSELPAFVMLIFVVVGLAFVIAVISLFVGAIISVSHSELEPLRKWIWVFAFVMFPILAPFIWLLWARDYFSGLRHVEVEQRTVTPYRTAAETEEG